MLKRTKSLNSSSNDHREASCLLRGARRFLPAAILLLIFGNVPGLFAQRQSGCDSVDVAWRYYERASFNRARALVANCEEPSALELQAFVALKNDDRALAADLLCKLSKSNPNYRPDSSILPILDFVAWLDELKRHCAGLQPPPPPFHPRRLFLLPDANVLESLEVNLGVGTDLFNSEVPEDNRFPPYLWHMSIGLGGIAEIEFSSIEVINRLKNGKPWLITGSLKFGISEGKLIDELPALAVFVQRSASWLHKDEKDNFEYKKTLTHLLFLTSKTFGQIRVQGGLGGMIPGLSVYNADTKRHNNFPGADPTQESDSTIYKWRFSGAAGLQWRANSLVSLMIEFNNLAEYDFDLHQVSNQELRQDSVKMVLKKQEVWLAGVRFSVTNSAFFDAGLMWRNTGKVAADLEEENPISFRLGFNFGFSTKSWF